MALRPVKREGGVRTRARSQTKGDIEVRNCESAKCDDLPWVRLTAFSLDTIPDVRAVLAQHVTQGARFSEYGWEVLTGNKD
jgi:hypothetical protein